MASREPTPLETKWEAVRQEMFNRLRESDWTQLLDAPLTTNEVSAWATYRQTLRDIPTTYNDPDLVVYPSPPRSNPRTKST